MEEAEVKHAEIVDEALRLLGDGDLAAARDILLQVIEHVPEKYSYVTRDGDCEYIRAWTRADFINYSTWPGSLDRCERIEWLSNAYPRAYYYLGYIELELDNPAEAIVYLCDGYCLEPENPVFHLELGHAWRVFGDLDRSLNCYEKIKRPDRFTTPQNYACALRGRGGVHIDMGELDEAERLYRMSLEVEPDNELAASQIGYIKDLRSSKNPTPIGETVSTRNDTPLDICSVCCRTAGEGSTLFNNEGKIEVVCEECMDKEMEEEI